MSSVDEVISFLTSSPNRIITTGLTLIATTIAIVVLRLKQRASNKEGRHRKAQQPPRRTTTATTAKLRNVFDVKQSSNYPVPKTSTKGAKEEKPFGSSYYYAHNSARANGGYKDGLRAEDYVMNEPRLLSRNGVAVENADENINNTDDDNNDHDHDASSKECPVEPTTTAVENSITFPTTQVLTPTTKSKENSIPINRYLWDDDGNSKGIAKMYIDSIPGEASILNSSSIIKWADAGLTKNDVVAKLLGEGKNGLMVQIRRQSQQGSEERTVNTSDVARYHLHVPRMHGEAREVKVIVKQKRLIVKIYKKKTTKIWPELTSKSTGVGDNSVDYIDEDLFRSIQ